MAEPMTAAQLLAALEAEGLTVKEHAGWKTHQRDSATGKPFGPVHGIVMHHTAGLKDLELIYNGRSDLPGPLAHAFIDKAGVVTMTSAGRANHAGGGDRDVYNAVVTESYVTKPPAPKQHDGSAGAMDGNDPFYGFECENLGDGKDKWPPAQYVAMVKAATAICRHYQWSAKSVIGHLEWSDWKDDPRGFTMATFRADVHNCLAVRPKDWPKTQPKGTTPVTPTAAQTQAAEVGSLYNDLLKIKRIDNGDAHAAGWFLATILDQVQKLQVQVTALQAKLDAKP